MQQFKLLCYVTIATKMCITICTTVRKIFDILLVVQFLIYSKKMFPHLAEQKLFMYLTCIQLSHNPQLSLAPLDSIQL